MAINQTVNETGIDLLWKAFELAVKDLIRLFPSILVALAIIAIYVLVAIILTKLIRTILTVLHIDELVRPIFKKAFSLINLIIVLLNIGIALLAVYTIVSILFPTSIEIVTTSLGYIARIASVIFLITFTFIMLDAVIERIRMEAKMRGFMFLMIFFITLVLIIDVTALSEQVKSALSLGISIGLGLAIGVFATWYFFHETLEKRRQR